MATPGRRHDWWAHPRRSHCPREHTCEAGNHHQCHEPNEKLQGWGSRRHARAPVDGGRLATGGCVVECRGGGGGLNLQVELLEEKLIADVVEGGEWHGPLDEILQVVVAGAKTTQKVQHEGAIGDKLTQIVGSPPCPSSDDGTR
jgi:hypothetical protein